MGSQREPSAPAGLIPAGAVAVDTQTSLTLRLGIDRRASRTHQQGGNQGKQHAEAHNTSHITVPPCKGQLARGPQQLIQHVHVSHCPHGHTGRPQQTGQGESVCAGRPLSAGQVILLTALPAQSQPRLARVGNHGRVLAVGAGQVDDWGRRLMRRSNRHRGSFATHCRSHPLGHPGRCRQTTRSQRSRPHDGTGPPCPRERRSPRLPLTGIEYSAESHPAEGNRVLSRSPAVSEEQSQGIARSNPARERAEAQTMAA